MNTHFTLAETRCSHNFINQHSLLYLGWSFGISCSISIYPVMSVTLADHMEFQLMCCRLNFSNEHSPLLWQIIWNFALQACLVTLQGCGPSLYFVSAAARQFKLVFLVFNTLSKQTVSFICDPSHVTQLPLFLSASSQKGATSLG